MRAREMGGGMGRRCNRGQEGRAEVERAGRRPRAGPAGPEGRGGGLGMWVGLAALRVQGKRGSAECMGAGRMGAERMGAERMGAERMGAECMGAERERLQAWAVPYGSTHLRHHHRPAGG